MRSIAAVRDAVIRIETELFQVRVVAIAEDAGRVLLHTFDEGESWSLPGGRLEIGETFHACIAREMREELGAEVDVGAVRWVIENFFEIERDDSPGLPVRHHEIGVYVDVVVPAHIAASDSFRGIEHRPDGTTFHMDFAWFELDSLAGMKVFPGSLSRLLASKASVAILEHPR
jgi:ADP-ribose pyrophosphatase YjhB (NUDIX family)